MRRSDTQLADLGIDLCQWRPDLDVSWQQKKFVRYFVGAPGPVVDLGCGRGVMLQLLQQANIESYGVDSFTSGLEVCRSRGVRVIQSDILKHIRQLSGESLGGIFCSHIIEHFSPHSAVTLLRECFRVLRPNGILVLITPNPRDLNVLTEVFWLDLTHVRFYPGRLLDSLLRHLGFSSVQAFEDRDTQFSRILWRRIAGFIRKLWLWGLTNRGDLVVVARK